MKTKKHPRDLSDLDVQAMVSAIEAAALAAHRAGLSWGVIGAQLGMTRQGARQRFERLVGH